MALEIESDESDPPLPTDFRTLLRTLRRRQGYTQEELAQRAFASKRKATISELENDPDRVVHPATLVSLADALELSARERSLLAFAAERHLPPDIEPATSPSTRTARVSRLTTRGAVGAVIVLVVAAAAGAAALLTAGDEQGAGSRIAAASQPTTAEPPITESTIASVDAVDIHSPLDGEMVDSPLTVHGVARIGADESLWLVLKPLTDTTFYVTTPVSIPVTRTGEWSSRLRPGRGPQDVGYEFDLFAVVSPTDGIIERATEIKPAGQYGAHLGELPSDAVVAEQLRITLGRYTG